MAANTTISGLHRAFALTTAHACWHRWLTDVPWDVTAVPERRLAGLPQAPQTRDSVRGGMAMENTRVAQTGQLSEAVGWFCDPADQRHVMAHD